MAWDRGNDAAIGRNHGRVSRNGELTRRVDVGKKRGQGAVSEEQEAGRAAAHEDPRAREGVEGGGARPGGIEVARRPTGARYACTPGASCPVRATYST